MNPLISIIVITLFVTIAIGFVFSMGVPLLDQAKVRSQIGDAQSIMTHLFDYIQQVSEEGSGSSRTYSFSISSGDFEALSKEKTISYKIDGPPVMEYFSRKQEGGITTTSGNDVTCTQDDNYISMENSFFKILLEKNGGSESWAPINTSSIISLTNKISGLAATIKNSSVVINSNSSSSYGNGYSELLKSGTNLPACIAHVFINSSQGKYDIYYTLFSGADFVIQDIRNSDFAKEIATNLAFHINSTDTIRINDTEILSTTPIDSTYYPEKKFISSQSNGSSLGMVFAGQYLKNISLNTTYPGGYYILTMRQGYENNRVLLSLTSGTWQGFDSKSEEAASDKIIGKTFGNYSLPTPEKARTTLMIFLGDMRISESQRWSGGTHEMVIKNMGETDNQSIIDISLR